MTAPTMNLGHLLRPYPPSPLEVHAESSFLKGTWWLQFFDLLGPDFPAPDASGDTWRHFVVQCSYWPNGVLAVGVMLALTVLCCSCLCRPRPREVAFRPSSKPAVCLGFLSLLLICAGSFIYWRTGSMAWETAGRQLDRAISDAKAASGSGTRLSDVGSWVLKDIAGIPSACLDLLPPQVKQAVMQVEQQVTDYKSQVDSFNNVVQPLPKRLADAKDKASVVFVLTLAALLTPTAVVLLCCMAVTFAVVCNHRGRCSLCCVQSLGPVLFAPTILVLGVCAGVTLEVGIVASSFCSDVDANALAFVDHAYGPDSTAYQMAHYYIKDMGRNPLLEDLKRAETAISEVNTTVAMYSGALGAACPTWQGAGNLTASLGQVQAAFGIGERILSEGNVRPYYTQVVHKDACEFTLIGLGWLFLLQAVVGLICLPFLITVAIRYLKARIIWRSTSGAFNRNQGYPVQMALSRGGRR